MSNVFFLFTVLNKNYLGQLFIKDKQNKWTYALYILLVVVISPSLIAVGIFAYFMYGQMALYDQGGYIIALAFNAIATITLVLSFFIVPGVLYFSKDIQTLLPLPLKPHEIITAKMLVAYMYEYGITLLIALPFLIGYCLAASPLTSFYFFITIALIFLPVLPILVATLLNIVIMAFSRLFKNQDRFNFLSFAVFIILTFIYVYTMQTMGVQNEETIIHLLMQGNNSLASTVLKIIPTVPLFIRAVIDFDLSALFLAVLLSIAFVPLFYLVAQKLYFIGVLKVNDSESKKMAMTSGKMTKATKISSYFYSYIKKDFLILLRTPIFCFNTIIASLLVPVFLLAPFALSVNNPEFDISEFSNIVSALPVNSLSTYLVFAFFGFVLGFMFSPINNIAVTAVSREGDNFNFTKQVPIALYKQLQAKLALGILVSFVNVFIVVIAVVMFFRINLLFVLMMMLASTFSVLIVNYLGLLIDIVRPKLDWQTENQVVKQNFNIIVLLLASWTITAIIVVLSLRLFSFANSKIIVFVIAVVALTFIIYLLHLLCKKATIRLLNKTN